jgi:HAD superfamily hydrolase (TIGR01490 family)
VKKEIALFDFDGTITTKDTLIEFIRFAKGPFWFYLGFILNLPYLIGYKLKFISNQTAKEKVLQFFFRDTPVEIFTEYCTDFSKNVLPKLIRPKAFEEIRRLKERNTIVVIVSASPENWVEAWARRLQLEVITTRLEVKNGMITGKIVGKNCHGKEKVNRITEKYKLNDYRIVAAYGDTNGDKPMLSLAQKAYYKPFN